MADASLCYSHAMIYGELLGIDGCGDNMLNENVLFGMNVM